ncbi:hypothetical protein BDQ17DRAFT_1428502 [Cyathus striatus]|nr:hypothetical protein BDQ17DRAFT_1428502 [Cyathus striatus]
MPTIPLRQRFLHKVFSYAQFLQSSRRRKTTSYCDNSSDSDTSSSDEHSSPQNSEEESCASTDSDLSSLSSISSISSLESSGSQDDRVDGEHSDIASTVSDDDEDINTASSRAYLRKLAVIHDCIKFIVETRVLEPNHVHKLSQLYLILVLFKECDSKRFRKNLRVDPATFDSLLEKIRYNPIFVSSGPNEQIPVEEQLAIALYRFGHFGNAASVEAIAHIRKYLNCQISGITTI